MPEIKIKYLIQDLVNNKYLSNDSGDCSFKGIFVAKAYDDIHKAQEVVNKLATHNKFLTIIKVFR